MRTTYPDIDAYIASFPDDVRPILEQVRATIKAAAPGATEAIRYAIPAFVLHGNLVFFAAFKHHVSVYPAPRGTDAFRAELAAYAGGKGTVRFPLDRPIPYDLITRIVAYRVEENLARAAGR